MDVQDVEVESMEDVEVAVEDEVVVVEAEAAVVGWGGPPACLQRRLALVHRAEVGAGRDEELEQADAAGGRRAVQQRAPFLRAQVH